ncbi:MAG: heme exporter protein CcmB [Actinomycetota bacterium]
MTDSGAAAARPPERGFLAKVTVLASKDLRVEMRGRDTLPPMLAFSLAVTLLLAFSLPPDGDLRAPADLPVGTASLGVVLAAFLWITVLFAGLVGFARTFEVEREAGAIEVLLLVPIDRTGLFLGKAGANLFYVVAVEVLLLPAFGVLFSLDLGAGWLVLLLITALVDIGFVAIGTLFASVAAHTRSRELMLPILALPTLVPIFLAAVELTSDLLLGGGLEEVAAKGWFGILVAFDVIVGVAAALAFEYVLD